MFSFEYLVHPYALFLGLCFLLWRLSVSPLDHYWKKKGISFKKSVPIFGNVANFVLLRQSYYECIDEHYRHFQNDSICGLDQFRTPILLVRNPELIHDILVTNFHKFNDRGFDIFFPHKDLNPLTSFYSLSDKNRWQLLRNKITPAFTLSKIRLCNDRILDCLSKLNVYIKGNMTKGSTDLNLKALYQRLSIDVICSCAFSITCDNTNLKNEEIAALVDKSIQTTTIRLLIALIHKKYRLRFKLSDMPKDVTKFFKNLVLDLVIQRQKNDIHRNDYLQMLMELQNTHRDPKYATGKSYSSLPEDERFDEIDIVANAFLFFLSAFDGLSSAMSFCLYELAINENIQDELRAEVRAAFDKNGQVLHVDMLKDLKYLNAVITETLRKYPTTPFATRVCVDELRIENSNTIIEKGDKIFIPSWSIHHDEKYYPNPEMFDPMRFYDKNKDKISRGTFLSFGDGPRSCIGGQFARAVVKIAIADAVLRYEFKPCSKTEIPITYKGGAVSVSAKNGVWAHIARLEHE